MNQEDLVQLQKMLSKIDELPINHTDNIICDFNKEHVFRKLMKKNTDPFPAILQSFPNGPPSFSHHFYRDFSRYFGNIPLNEQQTQVEFLSYLFSSSNSTQCFQEIQPCVIFPFLFTNIPNSFSLLFSLLLKSSFHCSCIASFPWPSHFLSIVSSFSQEDKSKILFFLDIVKKNLDFKSNPEEQAALHELLETLLNYFFEINSFEDQFHIIKILQVYSKQNLEANFFSLSQYQKILPHYISNSQENEQYLTLISKTLNALPESLAIVSSMSEETIEPDQELFKEINPDLILQAISPLIFSNNENFQYSSCKYLQAFLVSEEFSNFLIQNVPQIIDQLLFLASESCFKTRIEALILILGFIQLNDHNLLLYLLEKKIIPLLCSFLTISDNDILTNILKALSTIGFFVDQNKLVDQAIIEISEYLSEFEELENYSDKHVSKAARHIINMIKLCQLL